MQSSDTKARVVAVADLLTVATVAAFAFGVVRTLALSVARTLPRLAIMRLMLRALFLLGVFWARDAAKARGFNTTAHDVLTAIGCAACVYPRTYHHQEAHSLVRLSAVAALATLFMHALVPTPGTIRHHVLHLPRQPSTSGR